ncbi:MAG: glycosyltransferase [Anaerolineae bacterium]|nr:glycosyltransferase [Anaerolineae bacterium]
MIRRLCTFGAYDPEYPRNLVIRRGLAALGVEVIECRVSPKLGSRARARELARLFTEVAADCDAILLAEFNASLAWLAGRLARRSHMKLVIDPFVSFYNTAVHDRATAGRYSPAALYYWLLDALALHLPGLGAYPVLVDTAAHGAYFSHTFRVAPGRFFTVPVGAPREWLVQPDLSAGKSPLLVQFYGTYIPLHGIETILRAMALLREHSDLRFELIGHGQTFPQMRVLARELGLVERVVFSEPVAPAALPARVAQADIALGIFGQTAKAAQVVPNKVYQALALGKAVITGDTPALHEMFTPGEHLLATPPGDAPALAQAIRRLADDAGLRARLGAAGRACMESAFSEQAIAARVLEALGW